MLSRALTVRSAAARRSSESCTGGLGRQDEEWVSNAARRMNGWDRGRDMLVYRVMQTARSQSCTADHSHSGVMPTATRKSHTRCRTCNTPYHGHVPNP